MLWRSCSQSFRQSIALIQFCVASALRQRQSVESTFDLVDFHRRARLQHLSVQVVDVSSNGLGREVRGADAVSVDDLSMVDRNNTSRHQFLLGRCRSLNCRYFLLLREEILLTLSTAAQFISLSTNIDRFALLRVQCNCRGHDVGFSFKPAIDNRLIADVVRRVVCVSRVKRRRIEVCLTHCCRFNVAAAAFGSR